MRTGTATARKVMLALDFYPPRAGGMETHGLEFAHFFAAHPRYRLVSIIAFPSDGADPSAAENPLPIAPTLLSEADTFDATAFIAAGRAAALGPGDIVFFNSMYWMRLLPELRQAFPGTHFIQRSGGNDMVQAPLRDLGERLSERRERVCALVANGLDALIVTSQYSVRRLERLGLPRAKLHPIVGGVDLTAFSPATAESRRAARRMLGWPEDAYIVLDVSRLVPFKGTAYAIQAAKRLRGTLGDHFRFVIVGDGPLKPQLLDLVRQNGMSDTVRFAGEVPLRDMHLYYQAADAFCHTATRSRESVAGGSYIHTESMGRCLIEASAAGLPIVATDVGGVSEVIEPGETGLLVPSRRPDRIAEALETLYADRAQAERLGENARAKTERLFSWDAVFAEYIFLFDSLQNA